MSSNDKSVKVLRDGSGDIAKVVRMGIPESAILAYIVHAHDDQSREKALQDLLVGRSLASEQIEYLKTVLNRFPL